MRFNKVNFKKLSNLKTGIVVFGTDGGIADNVEFRATAALMKTAHDNGTIDNVYINARAAVNAAKTDKRKGRKYMIREADD